MNIPGVPRHMLRARLGAAKFDAAIKAVYAQRSGQTTRLTDVQRVFDRVGGTSTGAFFTQWLGRSGRPEVAIENLRLEAAGKGHYMIGGELVQMGTPYHMRVPLVVVTAMAPRVYDVDVTAARTPFSLSVPTAPHELHLDPLRDTLVTPIAPISLE